MPLAITTAEEARHRFVANPASRWHQQGADPLQLDGVLASQRLRCSPFTPHITPGFQIDCNDKLYAIGSCFARGVEAALLGRKMSVLSRAAEFDAFPQNRDEQQLGFVNKYNVFSIYNELNWALNPKAHFPEESIVPVGEGLFYDPHTNPSLELASLEETLKRRAILRSVTMRIRQCRVVIITLGLVEVWRDRVADVVINTTPIPEAFKHHPERYEFRVSSFEETLRTLEQVHALLMQHSHPDTHIIVTVSPVPLMATFSGEDVVVANTYSKSMLRAVAQEWASHYANVDYFPSYEIVQNSDRDTTWIQDLRHVRGETVQHIMKLFLRHYLSAGRNQVAA